LHIEEELEQQGSAAKQDQEPGGIRGVDVGNTATDAADINGENIALSFFE
jgi:hypothetical protein